MLSIKNIQKKYSQGTKCVYPYVNSRVKVPKMVSFQDLLNIKEKYFFFEWYYITKHKLSKDIGDGTYHLNVKLLKNIWL